MKKEGDLIMEKQNLFNVEEGVAFVVTTQSENIKKLKDVSEKYCVKLPDAKFIIIHTGDLFEFYYELKDYGVTEYAFGLPDQYAGNKDMDRIRKYALITLENSIDEMSWSNILRMYLEEEGIEYEDD